WQLLLSLGIDLQTSSLPIINSMRKVFIIVSSFLLLSVLLISLVWKPVFWFLILLIPFILIGIYDIQQKRHSISRDFPIFGHVRFMMEALRPGIYQYFVESNTDGRPFSRINRSLIYQRAKTVDDTVPF